MGSSQKHSARRRDPYEVARRRMVSEQLIPGGVRDERVLAAMTEVPRHLFVSPGMERQAYEDRPLPIGFGQTISQPVMVGIMSAALETKGNERILEIGTGSGYQAAILSRLVKELFTIERILELSVNARKAIYRLEYNNIKLRVGDGTLGWKEEAPFDGIIVTAGAPVVPEALFRQLRDGGKLIVPVGGADIQHLEVIENRGGEPVKKSVTACRFVKLIGKEGWENEKG